MVGTGTVGLVGAAVASAFIPGSGIGDADASGTAGIASGSSGGITTGGSGAVVLRAIASVTAGTCGSGGSPAVSRAYTVTPAAATAAAVTSQ